MAYAAVYGMRTETHLQGQQYSWLGSIFYLGYLAMEMPTVWLLTKVPLGNYIGGTLFAWGGVVCCMAACSNFAGLATVRFLLGVFEAGILPALLLVNSLWYTKREQPLRTALWYNTFAGVSKTRSAFGRALTDMRKIFGGILSFAIGKINGLLSTWKV
jgi:MFS family permease